METKNVGSEFEGKTPEQIATILLGKKNAIDALTQQYDAGVQKLIAMGVLNATTVGGEDTIAISTTEDTVNQSVAMANMDDVGKSILEAKQKKAVANVKFAKSDLSPAMLAVEGILTKRTKVTVRWKHRAERLGGGLPHPQTVSPKPLNTPIV